MKESDFVTLNKYSTVLFWLLMKRQQGKFIDKFIPEMQDDYVVEPVPLSRMGIVPLPVKIKILLLLALWFSQHSMPCWSDAVVKG